MDAQNLSQTLQGAGPFLVVAVSLLDISSGFTSACLDQVQAADDLYLILGNDSQAVIGNETFNSILNCTGDIKLLIWGDIITNAQYGENLVERILGLIKEKEIKSVFAPSVSTQDPIRAALGVSVWEAVRRSVNNCRIIMFPITVDEPCTSSGLVTSKVSDVILSSIIDTHTPNHQPLKSLGYRPIDQSALSYPIDGIASHWHANRPSPDTQPLVSVIIRSTNRPELADALDSIAMQTYPAIEVVVVDVEGLETLDPGAYCGTFPIRIASTGFHLGRGAAANAGLTIATGTYAIFLDDDDWFLPDHIHSLVSVLLEHDDFSAAYAGVECRQRDENGDWRTLHVFNHPPDPIKLLIQNFLPIHAVMFVKALFGPELRFDESLLVYEDWDFWVQLSQKTDFIQVDRISAIYRIGQGSGFGVTADESHILEGLHGFFSKWRLLWTTDQIIGFIRYFIPLTPKFDDTAAILARQNYLISQLKSGLALLQTDVHELRSNHPHLETIESTLHKALEQKQAELHLWHQRSQTFEMGLIESKSLLQSIQVHTSELADALREAEFQLAKKQSDLRAEHDRAETLQRVSTHLLEKNEATEERLAKSEERVRTHETRRQTEFFQLYQVQLSPFWPVLTRLLRTGNLTKKAARFVFSTFKILGLTISFRLPSAWRRRATCQLLDAAGLFDPVWYIQKHPEVLFVGYKPIYHWLSLGWRQGYDPHPLFSTRWYLEQNPDVAQAGIDPLLHYLRMGAGEGRDPHPLFDSDWYLEQNPDVALLGINPLSHFIQQGFHDGRSPHPLFDLGWYLEQ